MNLQEARNKLANHGIYQLNNGETLANALDHVDNGSIRKGYRVRADNGRPLSENEIRQQENRAAFARSFTPPTYTPSHVDDVEDATDCRHDTSKRGTLANCYYCGDSIRIDGDDEDYTIFEDVTHCEDCSNAATMNLAM